MLSKGAPVSKAGHAPYVDREIENACQFIDKADKRSVVEMTDLKIEFKQRARTIDKGPYLLLS